MNVSWKDDAKSKGDCGICPRKSRNIFHFWNPSVYPYLSISIHMYPYVSHLISLGCWLFSCADGSHIPLLELLCSPGGEPLPARAREAVGTRHSVLGSLDQTRKRLPLRGIIVPAIQLQFSSGISQPCLMKPKDYYVPNLIPRIIPSLYHHFCSDPQRSPCHVRSVLMRITSITWRLMWAKIRGGDFGILVDKKCEVHHSKWGLTTGWDSLEKRGYEGYISVGDDRSIYLSIFLYFSIYLFTYLFIFIGG